MTSPDALPAGTAGAPDDGPSDDARQVLEYLERMKPDDEWGFYPAFQRHSVLEKQIRLLAEFALRAARSPAGTGGEPECCAKAIAIGRDEALSDAILVCGHVRTGKPWAAHCAYDECMDAITALRRIPRDASTFDKLTGSVVPSSRPGSAPDAAIPERIWVEIAREMADDGSHSVVDLSVVDGPDPHADYPYQEVVEYVRARPVEATPEVSALALADEAIRIAREQRDGAPATEAPYWQGYMDAAEVIRNKALAGRPVEVTGGEREAESVISELLRVEGWGNCASEWEMRRAYSAAYKRARDFMSPPGRSAEADAPTREGATDAD